MRDLQLKISTFYTHIVNSIYEGVVAAVAHRQPITAEPDDVDVPVSEAKTPRNSLFIFISKSLCVLS